MLTQPQLGEARGLIQEAQVNLGLAIQNLRMYYGLTGDDRIFRIIHALDSRHSQHEDCLGAAYNLDDVLKSLYTEEEA